MSNATTFIQSQLTTSKSFSNFRPSIRAAIRGLYKKEFGLFAFVDSMSSAIRRNYHRAWLDGAKECGITESELTREEIDRREDMINEQIPHLVPFGQDIIAGRDSKLIGTFFSRGDVWANRWFEVINLAKSMACGNQKLVWRLGDAEHCKTCLKLAGRVMRASRWQQLDVWPRDTRSGKLDCNGFNCACNLVKTDARGTPGRLPSLP